MVDALTLALAHTRTADPYLELPECIRQYYNRTEWMYMSDEQKANLELTETEPDPE